MSPVWVLLLFHFWAGNPSRCRLYTSSFYFNWFMSPLPPSLSLFRCVSHSLPLPFHAWVVFRRFSGLSFFCVAFLRSLYVVAPSLFLLSFVLFVFPIFLFIATMSLLATFLSVVFYQVYIYIFFPAYLGRYYRFLIWFGSVYLVTTAGFVADQLMWDKQQQQQLHHGGCIALRWRYLLSGGKIENGFP